MNQRGALTVGVWGAVGWTCLRNFPFLILIGKKKSKFQTLKKFFARKKRKEPPAAGADAWLKASQSTDNVSKTSENNTLTRSEKDKGSG